MRSHDEANNVFSLAIARASRWDSQWALDSVHCSLFNGEVVLELCFPEFAIFVPASSVQELSQATLKGLQALRLSPARYTIISDSLDAHISVEGLVKDFLRGKSIGILPQDQIRARTLAIAGGELKVKAGDSKIWFDSLKACALALKKGAFGQDLGGITNPT